MRRYLRDNNPDIIVNVVDGSNLERNLYLTTELIDMDLPMTFEPLPPDDHCVEHVRRDESGGIGA